MHFANIKQCKNSYHKGGWFDENACQIYAEKPPKSKGLQ